VAKRAEKKKGPKRAWSTEFTPRKPVRISVSQVPFTLRERFAAKCRGRRKSQRNLLLGWIQNWVNGLEPKWEPASDLVEDEKTVPVETEAQAS